MTHATRRRSHMPPRLPHQRPILPQCLLKRIRRQRRGIQIPLHLITPGTTQKRQLIQRLDTFRNYTQTQLPRHADDRPGNRAVAAVRRYPHRERAVDLQSMNREPLQIRQAREPGPEIVQRQRHAQRRDLVHDGRDAIHVVHQRAFGDLQLQPRRVELVAPQRGGHALRQRWREFARRHVHRDAERRDAGALPDRRLRAGFFQHPFADLHDQTRGFGQRDEFAGRHNAALGMHPAYQRFRADQAAARDFELRLVIQHQLAVAQRVAQAGFNAHALLHALVHVLAVEGDAAVGVGVVALGPFHRDVGQRQQGFGVVAVLRVDADADAGAQAQVVAADQERCVERRLQLLRHRGGFEVLAYIGQADGVFVARQARYQVFVAQRGLEALADLLEQFIADAPAQRVVDALEAVQVDEQDAAGRLVALRDHQGLVDQAREQRAVWQAGQFVVVGQVVQLLFGVFAFGDVGQVGDQAARAAGQVAQGRQRQAGPEDVARLLAAFHLHHASAVLGEQVGRRAALLVAQVLVGV